MNRTGAGSGIGPDILSKIAEIVLLLDCTGFRMIVRISRSHTPTIEKGKHFNPEEVMPQGTGPHQGEQSKYGYQSSCIQGSLRNL